jgi:hypothetical protein
MILRAFGLAKWVLVKLNYSALRQWWSFFSVTVAQMRFVYIFASTNPWYSPQPAGQCFQFYTEAARD